MLYFKSCSLPLTIIFLITFIFYNGFSVSASFWLSAWSDDLKANSTNYEEKKYFRLSVFSGLLLSQCVVTFLTDFIFIFMRLRSSKILHDSMLYSILRSTMEFFESTPSGRIINRFSKDVDAVEKSIPDSLKTLIRCILDVLSTILIISYSTPLFLVALLPIAIVYILIQVNTI